MTDWIIFFIDKGCALPMLLDTLTGVPCILSHPDCPSYDRSEAEATIRALVSDGTLVCGPAFGAEEYVVITKFMPVMAEALRQRRQP